MIDFLIETDTNAFLWLNSHHNLFWDIVMKMASGKIIWGGLYIALVYALWRAYGWRIALSALLTAALCVLIADQVTASLMRPYFARLRPANLENPISPLVHVVDGYRAGRYGFPSSHASNTFAIATMLSLIFKRRRFTVAIFIWALLNCYSRIYLGVHYTGDILTGLILGSIVGWLIYLFWRWVVRRFGFNGDLSNGDRRMTVKVGSVIFTFRAVDIPIIIELLTMVTMVLTALAILY